MCRGQRARRTDRKAEARKAPSEWRGRGTPSKRHSVGARSIMRSCVGDRVRVKVGVRMSEGARERHAQQQAQRGREVDHAKLWPC